MAVQGLAVAPFPVHVQRGQQSCLPAVRRYCTLLALVVVISMKPIDVRQYSEFMRQTTLCN